jgi:hypothetical protein
MIAVFRSPDESAGYERQTIRLAELTVRSRDSKHSRSFKASREGELNAQRAVSVAHLNGNALAGAISPRTFFATSTVVGLASERSEIQPPFSPATC